MFHFEDETFPVVFNPSALAVLPWQHILLTVLPNNITAHLNTTKNHSWKPAVLHCMGAHNFTLLTIVPYCRRNIPLAVSICSISSTNLLAMGKFMLTLCCLMRFSSIDCLCLHVCIFVWSFVLKSVVRSCFIACIDSDGIRDNCFYTPFNTLGGTGTPASAGQSHPRVFRECQDSEKWQLLSLCKEIHKLL